MEKEKLKKFIEKSWLNDINQSILINIENKSFVTNTENNLLRSSVKISDMTNDNSTDGLEIGIEKCKQFLKFLSVVDGQLNFSTTKRKNSTEVSQMKISDLKGRKITYPCYNIDILKEDSWDGIIPKKDYSIKLELNEEIVSSILKTISVFGDSVDLTFSAKKDENLNIEASSEASSSAKQKITLNFALQKNIDGIKEISFDTMVIKNILSVNKNSVEAYIEIINDPKDDGDGNIIDSFIHLYFKDFDSESHYFVPSKDLENDSNSSDDLSEIE